MSLPVVTVASGGIPVVDVTGSKPLLGMPVSEAVSGRGLAVTKVANFGMPVAYDAGAGRAGPTLDLVTAFDSGSSSVDNITSNTTPSLDVTFGQLPTAGDVLKIYDNGVLIVTHTVTAPEAGSGTLSLGLSALADGVHSLAATHTIAGPDVSAFGPILSITIDTTAPTIITSGTQTVAENSALSLQLAANETVTWTKTGGADTALFTLTGGGLLSMTAKNFEIPTDANTDNAYIVQVTATDPAGNVTNKTITVTVTNVNEAPTVANPLIDKTAAVGSAFSYQFASNSFADVDAGNVFTYSATLVSGGALPAWLTFTAATRTFSGTPGGGDVGTISVRVTATDSGSLTVTDDFDIVTSVAPSGVVAVFRGALAWQTGGFIFYPSVSIGADDPTRIVQVLAQTNHNAGNVISVEINGITANLSGHGVDAANSTYDIYWLPVPTGATCSVKIIAAGGTPNIGSSNAAVYTHTGSNGTPDSSASTPSIVTFTTEVVGPIAIPANGWAAALVANDRPQPVTWSNCTTDATMEGGGSAVLTSFALSSSVAGSQTFTGTGTLSTYYGTIYMTWKP